MEAIRYGGVLRVAEIEEGEKVLARNCLSEKYDNGQNRVHHKNASENMLKTGDQAPAFEALDQNGNTITLADLLSQGKRIILYFYPKDNTPAVRPKPARSATGMRSCYRRGSWWSE